MRAQREKSKVHPAAIAAMHGCCIHNPLFSPVALPEDNGETKILTSEFSILSSSQYGNPYTFTGRRLDVLDGGDLLIMDYRHRTYSPELGRFMQQDPLGIDPAESTVNPFYVRLQYFDGSNLYAGYFANMRSLDPYGLSICNCNQLVQQYINDPTSEAFHLYHIAKNRWDINMQPCLEGIDCQFMKKDGRRGTYGGNRWIGEGNRITINEQNIDSEEELEKTLIHELYHATQCGQNNGQCIAVLIEEMKAKYISGDPGMVKLNQNYLNSLNIKENPNIDMSAFRKAYILMVEMEIFDFVKLYHSAEPYHTWCEGIAIEDIEKALFDALPLDTSVPAGLLIIGF